MGIIGVIKGDRVELSLKSEYAILALLELAGHTDDQPLQIRQIASQQNIPDRYLEQLLATLRRHGLVKSQRGSKGGYVLAREPWQISVLEIVRCIEGSDPFSISAPKKMKMSNAKETNAVAVVHELWLAAQLAAANVLANSTLKDLHEREKQRQLSTAMYYI